MKLISQFDLMIKLFKKIYRVTLRKIPKLWSKSLPLPDETTQVKGLPTNSGYADDTAELLGEMQRIIGLCEAEYYRDFLENISGLLIGVTNGGGIEDDVEEIIDRFDDLSTFMKAAECKPCEREYLSEVKVAIESVLLESGVELLIGEDWDPKSQRALTKIVDANIHSPTVSETGSSGYKLNGELYRKQEVCLLVPE